MSENESLEIEVHDDVEYLLYVTLSDGCIFRIDTPEDTSSEWEIVFPAGMNITCPHGLVFDTLELPEDY